MRPLLCATVVEPTMERALQVAALVAGRADLVEVRLDALADPDPEMLAAAIPGPVVLTCRPESEGGSFTGTEEERLDLLAAGARAGAAWIDVELAAADGLDDRGAAKLIVSHHDFEGTPDDLAAIVERMEAHRPDVRKLVTTANGHEDVFRVIDLLRSAVAPLAAHTMGPAGLSGRLLAARFGSAIVYGAARAGAAGAPGQPTLRTLADDYRLGRDLAASDLVLLLGGRLGHSVSAAMMNRAFAAAGIDALYAPFETDDPAALVSRFADLRVRGAAVTIPLKETVIPLLTDLDEEARGAGAVNTVVRTGDRLRGKNTDLGGGLDAIRTALPELADRRALILGAGGAARALGLGLVKAGAEVVLVGRTAERATRAAAEIGARAAALEEVDPDAVDLVVNATPVGQWPDIYESPLPISFLRPGQVVMDAVYNPEETRLLSNARALGCRVVPGIEMLARQGARQAAAWFGAEIDPETLAGEARAALGRRNRTVLLIGMRGAGKTTVGRIVAERLGRPFVDLDEVVERRAGRTVAEIFSAEGEPRFRELELRAFESEIAEPGTVLAVGGGLFENPAAEKLAAERSPRTVLLDASPSHLAERIRDSARPALTDLDFEEEVASLAERRSPVYRRLANHVVDTGYGGPEAVADRVLEALGA